MTYVPEFLPFAFDRERLVLFVAFPGMCLLDLTGAQTVFWAASKYMQQRGLPGYSRHTVGLDGGLVPSVEGVALATSPLPEFKDVAVDTVVVPGSPDIEQVMANSGRLVEWLRRVSGRARRIASVCSGAFLLAQAGLLDGKRAATHWAMCDLLKGHFPRSKLNATPSLFRKIRSGPRPASARESISPWHSWRPTADERLR